MTDTTTTTIPAGIDTLAYRCWHLTWSGEPAEIGERVPHYRTEAEAQTEIDRDETDAVPQQADEPCVQAVARCGFVYDEDGDGIEHFTTPQDAHDAVTDAGWVVSADGVLHCPPGNGCDECHGGAA